MKDFSDIKIGDSAEFEVIIDEESHNSFAKISGDFSPIHSSDEFSSKTKFGRRIGYAFMLTGFLSRLYGEYLPGGSSVCVRQDAKFIKPFYLNDKIKVIGRVTNLFRSIKAVEITTEMYGKDQERIFRGVGLVQVLFENFNNDATTV